MEKCCGLAGMIFGHCFVESFNHDSSGLSAEQMNAVVKIVESDNAPLLDINTIQNFIDAAIPEIAVVKAVYCERCGITKAINGTGNQSK